MEHPVSTYTVEWCTFLVVVSNVIFDTWVVRQEALRARAAAQDRAAQGPGHVVRPAPIGLLTLVFKR